MADAPKKIWLQRPCRYPENEWFGEVTWCDDKINDDDTGYIREDEVERLRELLRRYQTETPLGHQPHMIAHLVDEALE